MKRFISSFACAVLIASGLVGARTADASAPPERRTPAPPAGGARPSHDFGRLPMRFEANLGQTDARVKFTARGEGYALFLTPTEAAVALHAPAAEGRAGEPTDVNVLRMRLRGASPGPAVAGEDRLPGASNYLVGDRSRWRTGVPAYAKVRYSQVYPGVDLVYYGNGGTGGAGDLEYDFVVAPGADPGQIGLTFEGTSAPTLDPSGDLLLSTPSGELRQHRPVLFQAGEGGERREVSGGYVLRPDGAVGFDVAAYDATRPLVIDPIITLSYSGYLHGRLPGQANAVLETTEGLAVDSAGSVYVTGSATTVDFPILNAFQARYGGGNSDAFVAKLSPEGDSLVYSTYLGGAERDSGHAIAVDAAGSAYVTGNTASVDFPTRNAFDASYGGGPDKFTGDGFVAKLGPGGDTLVYSTYLGGDQSDEGDGIAVDSTGAAYVTGFTFSTGFPTASALQSANAGNGDGFLTKLDPAGATLTYSTYLGGRGVDRAVAVALDVAGNAYVMGSTQSTDFPTFKPFQAALAGPSDGFVAKVGRTGTSLVYSTYLGGSGGEVGRSIAVDVTGAAYVTGNTTSTNFPTERAVQPQPGGGFGDPILNGDAYVAKLNPTGRALDYSTYLGGSLGDQGNCIAVDSTGAAYVLGFTASRNFPTATALQPVYGGGALDAFVTKLDAQGSSFVYSTFFGGSGRDVIVGGTGIRVDFSGNAYIVGQTFSTDFPVIRGLQLDGPPPGGGSQGNASGFIAKIVDLYDVQFEAPDPTSADPTPPPRFLVVRQTTATAADPAERTPTPSYTHVTAPDSPGNAVSCYNVYRSATPHVQTTPGNLFATVPPGQTVPAVPGGAFFVITACYANGAESGPSNEASGGGGEAILKTVTVGKSVTADGTLFTDAVQVTIDGIPFTAPAKVSASNTKVIQKGKLSTGLSLSKYLKSLPAGSDILIAFVNSNNGIATIKFTK